MFGLAWVGTAVGPVIVVAQFGLVVGDLGVMIGRVAGVTGAEQIGADVGAVSVTGTAFDAVCRCVCADDLVEEGLRPLLGRPATGPEIDAVVVLVVSLIVSLFFENLCCACCSVWNSTRMSASSWRS